MYSFRGFMKQRSGLGCKTKANTLNQTESISWTPVGQISTTFLIWAASWQNQQYGMCAQWRRRSAWASAQSDQSLRCALSFFMRTANTLIRLGAILLILSWDGSYIPSFYNNVINLYWFRRYLSPTLYFDVDNLTLRGLWYRQPCMSFAAHILLRLLMSASTWLDTLTNWMRLGDSLVCWSTTRRSYVRPTNKSAHVNRQMLSWGEILASKYQRDNTFCML